MGIIYWFSMNNLNETLNENNNQQRGTHINGSRNIYVYSTNQILHETLANLHSICILFTYNN